MKQILGCAGKHQLDVHEIRAGFGAAETAFARLAGFSELQRRTMVPAFSMKKGIRHIQTHAGVVMINDPRISALQELPDLRFGDPPHVHGGRDRSV